MVEFVFDIDVGNLDGDFGDVDESFRVVFFLRFMLDLGLVLFGVLILGCFIFFGVVMINYFIGRVILNNGRVFVFIIVFYFRYLFF